MGPILQTVMNVTTEHMNVGVKQITSPSEVTSVHLNV